MFIGVFGEVAYSSKRHVLVKTSKTNPEWLCKTKYQSKMKIICWAGKPQCAVFGLFWFSNDSACPQFYSGTVISYAS